MIADQTSENARVGLHHSAPDNPIYRRFLDPPPGRPSGHKWHHYFDGYLRAMQPFIGKPVTMFEIGIANGGSLWMWQDVLGPQAKLVGLDIDRDRRREVPPGVEVFIGDQADPRFLRHVVAKVGAPTIVLDDGGHTMRQMIVSFETLYPLMPSPSVYIIEDTHTAFRRVFQDDPKDRTIYDVAFDACRKLQAWTGPGRNIAQLRQHPAERREALSVPDICRMTRSISFLDSMIIFERDERPEPWVEVRRGAPSQRAQD